MLARLLQPVFNNDFWSLRMNPIDYRNKSGLLNSGTLPQKIAVIGTGAAGLAAAWSLSKHHEVVLYEASSKPGGHCHTVDVPTLRGTVPVDTGFIVFNRANYPTLSAAFDHLQVPTRVSEMSFSVSVDNGRLEYCGAGMRGLFAQPSNAVNPYFWRMLSDVVRFYRGAGRLAHEHDLEKVTLGELLEREGYSSYFRYHHLYPMAAAIWSMPVGDIDTFPAASFISFFEQHGLFQLRSENRPVWRTVTGGSRTYVERLLSDFEGTIRTCSPVDAVRRSDQGIHVASRGGEERFDQVVMAAHGDQSLALLANPTADERRVLGAFHYEKNDVLLHMDTSLMPRRRRVWSSWNYLSDGSKAADGRLSVTYWMNRLQGIESRLPLFVSLNPLEEPDSSLVIGEYSYDHPSYDHAALSAQKDLGQIQGVDRLWYCGSYFGYGFHEDAFASGIAVASALGARAPWDASSPQRADAEADRAA